MKKLLLLATFFISISALNYSSAQVRFGLHINVGLPGWISSGEYNEADYYYLPEIDAYYYVPQRQFIYMNDGNLIFSEELPSWCGNYDLYRGSKVPIYESRPYLHADRYRERYASQYRSDYAYNQPQHRARVMDNRYAVNNGIGYGRGGRDDSRHESENRYSDRERNDTRTYDRGRNESYQDKGRQENNDRGREWRQENNDKGRERRH